LTAARDELCQNHPRVEFQLGPPLGPAPLLADLVAKRVARLDSGADAPLDGSAEEAKARYRPLDDEEQHES